MCYYTILVQCKIIFRFWGGTILDQNLLTSRLNPELLELHSSGNRSVNIQKDSICKINNGIIIQLVYNLRFFIIKK